MKLQFSDILYILFREPFSIEFWSLILLYLALLGAFAALIATKFHASKLAKICLAISGICGGILLSFFVIGFSLCCIVMIVSKINEKRKNKSK